MPLDRFGRNIRYLRVSLTDHCNLRCVYCMPEEQIFRPNAELLQTEEFLRLIRIFTQMGVDKIRLTGGEPTVYPDLIEIVQDIKEIRGIREITMTTNGIRLVTLAEPLKRAGLDRVNVSLDTTDRHTFKRMTLRDYFNQAVAGIQAAEEAGLTPLKINAVIMRGFNEDAILDIAALTLSHPWQVRFIELMPLGGQTETQQTSVVTTGEMISRIEEEFGTLIPVNGGRLDGEAVLYKINGSQGNLGFISSVSQPFCAYCARARITADGKLRLCLLREDEIDLREPLRSGADDEQLRQMIASGIWRKPWGHGLADGEIAQNRAMNEIGG